MGHSSYIIIIIIISVFVTEVTTAVKGLVGDSALLPCSITEYEIQDEIENITVHWRDDEGKIVCDITGGKRRDEQQAPGYKNRVETFPEEYKKYNFSIKLNDLQKWNEREYICYILEPFNHRATIRLKVEDKPTESGNHREQPGELILIVFIGILLPFFLH